MGRSLDVFILADNRTNKGLTALVLLWHQHHIIVINRLVIDNSLMITVICHSIIYHDEKLCRHIGKHVMLYRYLFLAIYSGVFASQIN